MWPSILVWVVAIVGSPELTSIAAVAVPLTYAVVIGIFDFGIRYELKGRKDNGAYRIWTVEENGWRMHTGEISDLASLHAKSGDVAHVEKSLRLRDANPYSVGLNLTLGALAIDVSALLNPRGNVPDLVYAVSCHSVLLVVSCLVLILNQNADPNEVWRIRLTAMFSLLTGFASMAIAFLLVNGSP